MRVWSAAVSGDRTVRKTAGPADCESGGLTWRLPEGAEPMGEMSRPVADNANCAYFQCWVGLRASSMLDIAAGILGLASVGIFLAHALDTYRA